MPTAVVTIAGLADATEGTTPGSFQLTRTGDTSGTLTVQIEASGTASPVDDYAAPLIITFSSGEATATVQVPAATDLLQESTETIIWTVVSGLGYTAGNPAAATINLFDNTLPPPPPLPPPPAPPVAPPPALIVTTELDVVDATDGLTSLREAIQTANGAGAESQRITFSSTIYGRTILLSEQLPNIQVNVVIDGPGRDLLTVSRDTTKGAFRLFAVLQNSTTTIARLKLTNGLVDFGFNGRSTGGCIYSQGNLTVTDCLFRNNTISGDPGNDIPGRGGAIAGVTGTVTVTNSSFIENEATYGGAIFTDEGVTLDVTDSVFVGNIASKSGGAIYVMSDTEMPNTATFTGCQIEGNSAGEGGGGIFSDHANLILKGGTEIRDNSAERGGGVYVSGGNVTYNHVWIGWNVASIVGDGVYRFKATATIGAVGVTWAGDPINSETVVP